LKLIVLGCESLGVRGLSCFVEHRGVTVLIDPGVALGYTRRGFHPHPIQAVAGDEVRHRIVSLWSRSDYIVLTHMHGDHIPLYNANPFQLSLYSLPDCNGEIIVPDPALLSGRMRIRLEKIMEVYRERIIVAGREKVSVDGIVSVYGPFNHGLSRTSVYVVQLDIGERIIHLSDTELLSDEAVSLAVKLKPDIIITDGPPIYKYMHDPVLINTLLEKASHNLEKLSRITHTIIVDHHVLRCDEGYEWLTMNAEKYGKNGEVRILTGAEYMMSTPILLEAWRNILYKYYPEPNYWFKHNYTNLLGKYKPIYHEIRKQLNKLNNKKPTRKIFEEILQNIPKYPRDI
jgi:predicted metallo-beta-lactamase superfamily hydrolase